MNDIKQQTETFVQTIYDSLQQDQMRFNTSYQEIVEHFKTQIDNETYFYEDKMNTLMKALSSKIQALSAAEQSRDHGLKAMQFTLHQDQKRFNFSYNQIVENFKDNSNKTLQELVLKLQKVPGYDVLAKKRETVAFTAYRKSSQTLSNGQKVIFDQIWTNVGNGYEPSTGVFSAPHAGVYHFTAVVMSTNNNALYLTLYHNTVRTSSSFINGDGHKTGTFDVVFNLQKGDKVYISGGELHNL
ncbi:C1QL [Mytilus coruscus]|uniref:C1QL n=1 Tax=Mytilus coruscus TaxID=42192 RepID=A0A6J8EYG9_MYTCO|nr:C1QL [Mytilus coruscus]